MQLPALRANHNLRLGTLLWDDDIEVFLDYVSDTPPWPRASSATTSEPVRETGSNAESGATIWLLLDVARRLNTQMERVLTDIGLSLAEYQILDRLRRAGEPLSLHAFTMTGLCATLNAPQILHRMQADGWVRGLSDSEDARGLRAQLTARGLSVVERCDTQVDVVLADLAGALTARERQDLARLLDQIE